MISVAITKYLTYTSKKRKGLFGLITAGISGPGHLAHRQKPPDRMAYGGKKVLNFMAAVGRDGEARSQT